MPTDSDNQTTGRTYINHAEGVFYVDPIGGQRWIANCASETTAKHLAYQLEKLHALNFSAVNRGFTGIADELDALAGFMGVIAQASKNSDPEGSIDIALVSLQERGDIRTWSIDSPYFTPEPSAVLDPQRVGKDTSA